MTFVVALAVLGGLLIAACIRRGGEAHARIYPYYTAVVFKLIGFGGLAGHRLRLITWPDAELFRAFTQHSVRHFEGVRAAFRMLDRLPTVARGNRALGFGTAVDALGPRRHRLTAYSHPLQRPYFFIPGVPARTFYDPADFPWVRQLEAAFPRIRAELFGLLGESDRRADERFKEYRGEGGREIPGWNTFPLFEFGEPVEANCARCPQTTAVLDALPRCEKQLVMFSALNPGTHIPPHVGPMNGVLRAHLPLVVPRGDGCRIRVGDDVRRWEEGRVMIFDDSFRHEVWNEAEGTRIVLFLNVWHPCFAPAEIGALEAFRDRLYRESPIANEWRKTQRAPRPSTLILPPGERIAS
jgi:aspartyl/asparaginyl beta-hydroxylase (cupin superfamily)